jgi:hypothetical protein
MQRFSAKLSSVIAMVGERRRARLRVRLPALVPVQPDLVQIKN